MKKFLVIAMVALMVASLCACSPATPSGTTPSNTTPSGTTTPGTSVEPENSVEPTAAQQSEGDATFAEMVIVDNDNISIKLVSFSDDGIFGPSFTCELENKMSDKNLMFTMADTSVNGIMCEPLWAETVSAGKKSVTEIQWMNASLEDCGINYIETVETTFRAYNNDDWMEDDIYHEAVTFSVTNSNTSEPAVEEVKSATGFTEITLVSNDNIDIIVKDYHPDDYLGSVFVVYIENKTDLTITCTSEDASVNGIMCDPFWATSVAPGKKAYSELSWMSSTLEEKGIQEIEEVEFTLRVYDSNDWLADNIFNEIVKISVK